MANSSVDTPVFNAEVFARHGRFGASLPWACVVEYWFEEPLMDIIDRYLSSVSMNQPHSMIDSFDEV